MMKRMGEAGECQMQADAVSQFDRHTDKQRDDDSVRDNCVIVSCALPITLPRRNITPIQLNITQHNYTTNPLQLGFRRRANSLRVQH